MNYIDRLKRVAIPLGAIVALSTSAVPAQDRLTKDDLDTLAEQRMATWQLTPSTTYLAVAG